MGRQVPLGPHPGSVPVQLWPETRGSKRASGSVRSRQQQIVNVETERLDTDAMHERLVEGRDDTENRHPAQGSRMQENGTRRCNVHDPSANARYFDVSNTFQHLGGLTEAVS